MHSGRGEFGRRKGKEERKVNGWKMFFSFEISTTYLILEKHKISDQPVVLDQSWLAHKIELSNTKSR